MFLIVIIRIALEILGAIFLLAIIFRKPLAGFGVNEKLEIGEQVTAVLRKENTDEKRTVESH